MPQASAVIEVGMSAPLQGPSDFLGIEMRRGIQALFTRVNAEGGVNSRPLKLLSRNDNYDPALARQNVLDLLDVRSQNDSLDEPDARGSESVFALLGNVGTSTALETAPLATKNEVVFFAPLTGAQEYLRDGTNSPYVYNYRAGYYEEVAAMVDFIATNRQPRIIQSPADDSYRRIIALTQNDSFGDAGYQGLVNAYNRIAPLPQPDSTQPNPSISRLYHERDDVKSVEPAIEQTKLLLSNLLEQGEGVQSVALVLIATLLPVNKYVRAIKDWTNESVERSERLDVQFLHLSVGASSLADALTAAPDTYVDVRDGETNRSYAEGILVTQIVPHYDGEAEGIRQYRRDIEAYDGGELSFTSLEGYLGASLFAEALKTTGRNLSTSTLVATLNGAMGNIDLGFGFLMGFSVSDHQASHTVWGTMLHADGSFSVPFTWDPTRGIQSN
jgi:hypothetical protein